MRLEALSLAAGLALALYAPDARAGSPSCAGKLSGAVKGTFSCTVTATLDAERNVRLVIAAEAPPAGVASLAPADVTVPGPASARTWTLAALSAARSSLETSKGKAYSAEKGKPNRGEASLTLDTLEREAGGNSLTVTGSFQARLRAAGKKGEVVLEVSF